MDKIGILTFHGANNYGALLQCFALQEHIGGLGFEVEIINYIPDYISYPNKTTHFPYKSIEQFLKDLYFFIPHYLRNRASERFREKFLHIYPKNRIEDFSKLQYKAVIVGSDQIWNPIITNLDDAYFCKGVSSNIKKISYAASIGMSIYEKYHQDFFNKLKKIDVVSVREESAALFIKKLFFNKIDVVLDPTFLIDKEKWKSLLSLRCKINKPYILVYCLENSNKEFIDIVNCIINKLGLCVICNQKSFFKSRRFINTIKTFGSSGPDEFLSYLLHAEFVVTNSFHGTAFSIIFNKKFICVPHLTLGSRMTDLLKKFGLSERIVENKNQINDELISFDINYVDAENKIKFYKEKSFAFLRDALSF